MDLGTGGGEKALSQMPDAGMIIATDFSMPLDSSKKDCNFINGISGINMVSNAILTVIKVDAFVSSVFFLSFSV